MSLCDTPIQYFEFFCRLEMEMLISCSVILLLSVGYNAVSVFLSSVLFKKAPQDRKKTLRYGTIVSNGGFLGIRLLRECTDERIVLRFHFYDPGADCDVECWNIGIFKREERKYFEKGADASVYYRSLCRRNTNGNRSCIAGVSDENYFGVKQLQYTA